jgi:hypothetical protein
MSDDRDKPAADNPAYAWVPAELRPYMGKSKRELPKVVKPGEDPELDKAVAAFKALETETFSEPPPAQDLTVGMGNASEHVGPVTLPDVPVGATEADAAKVELGMEDVPRALPEYSPTRETVETKAVRVAKEAVVKTVGGHTQKLPVIKVQPPAEAPVEVPSERAPKQQSEDEPARPGGRGRAMGAALGGAVLLVATVIGIRAVTTGPSGEASSVPAVASSQAMAAYSVAPSVVASAAAQSADAPVASAPAAAPSTSAIAEPSATASRVVPRAAHPVGRAAKKSRPVDDPYGESPAPSAAATVRQASDVPTTQPTVAPAPAPVKTAPAASPRAGSIPEF